MNEIELAKLLRFVHALCPAQKFDEYTPDAWELSSATSRSTMPATR